MSPDQPSHSPVSKYHLHSNTNCQDARKQFVDLFVFPECTNPKKCRARFGLDQQSQWCKPCRYVPVLRAPTRGGHLSTRSSLPLYYCAQGTCTWEHSAPATFQITLMAAFSPSCIFPRGHFFCSSVILFFQTVKFPEGFGCVFSLLLSKQEILLIFLAQGII